MWTLIFQKPHLISILWLWIMNLQFHPVQDYQTLLYKIRDKLGCHTECWTRMVYPLNLSSWKHFLYAVIKTWNKYLYFESCVTICHGLTDHKSQWSWSSEIHGLIVANNVSSSQSSARWTHRIWIRLVKIRRGAIVIKISWLFARKLLPFIMLKNLKTFIVLQFLISSLSCDEVSARNDRKVFQCSNLTIFSAT